MKIKKEKTTTITLDGSKVELILKEYIEKELRRTPSTSWNAIHTIKLNGFSHQIKGNDYEFFQLLFHESWK